MGEDPQGGPAQLGVGQYLAHGVELDRRLQDRLAAEEAGVLDALEPRGERGERLLAGGGEPQFWLQAGDDALEGDPEERGVAADERSKPWLAGARIVKTFNTLYYQRLLNDSRPDLAAEERLAISVAADNPDAARAVSDLVDQIGFTPVAAGTLAESRRLQPGTTLYEAYRQARLAGATVTASGLHALLVA